MDDALPQSELTAYLAEIGRYPLLSADEERHLAQQVRDGHVANARLSGPPGVEAPDRAELECQVALGREARQQLVVSNLRLVVWIARHYRGCGLTLMDIIQEGNIGLQRGVDRYDVDKGCRLSTYVVWWVKQAIARALEKHNHAIHLPPHAADVLRNSRFVEEELQQEYGRHPSVDEVADRIGMSAESLATIQRAARSPLSLDVPLGDESRLTLADLVADDEASNGQEAHEREERLTQVADSIERLPARERTVLELRYGFGQPTPCTLEQVACQMGITRERVRQIEYRAVRRLRSTASVCEGLAAFAAD